MKRSNKLLFLVLMIAFYHSTCISQNGNEDQFLSFCLENQAFPPYKEAISIPPIPKNPYKAFFGSRIQKTMAMLSRSGEIQHNRVRILFYGQSIVQGLDSKSMIEYLQKVYPYADIEYENLAIGGFQAPNLVRTAVHDLYPWYPDLLIFHVYGGEESGDLERIIYNTRKYTCADILLFNHHYGWETDSTKLTEKIEKDNVSSEYWRYLAQKYGCELVDVRKEWKNYLDTWPQIKINTLMGDTIHSNVHPNKKGNKLLESLILRHLMPNPDLEYLAYSGWYNQVKEIEGKRFLAEKDDEITFDGEAHEIEKGVILNEGKLKLAFKGNRLVLNTIPGDAHDGKITVLIDEKAPSANPDLYYATRPSRAFSHWRPALKRVSLGANPIVEYWSLTITKIDRELELIEYELYGSKTGFDGKGSNKEDFTSNSGSIRIEARDFFIFESEAYTKKPTPIGFKIEWEIKPLFRDLIELSPDINTYLIAQGLKNDTHELKLIIEGEVPVSSITIYSPPLK